MLRPLSFALLIAACGSDAPSPVEPTPLAPAPEPERHVEAPEDEAISPIPSSVPWMPTDLSGASADAQTAFAVGSNALAFSLFAHRPDGNVVLGSGSISLALAMTWAGARGTTAEELAASAGFGPHTHAAVAGLLHEYNAPSSPFSLANRLYAEQSYDFSDAFGELMRARYAAPMELVDFRQDSNAARLRINEWVEDQTHERIQDLIPPPAVDASTRLVLVNAAYFLGNWQTPFESELTQPRRFSLAEGNDANVPTMLLNEALRHASIDGVRLAELPYEGGRFSMIIAVPEERFGLADVEEHLSQAQWSRWMASLASGPTSVMLPRFELKLEPSLSLVDSLKQLGVHAAFDDTADFTGIAPRRTNGAGLYVTDILHRAFIRVDEAGTEAAAATAVVMAEGAGGPSAAPFRVHANQPFLFFLRDVQSGLILFAGRVSDPR